LFHFSIWRKAKGARRKAKGARGIIVDFHEGLEGMANVVGWRAQYAWSPCSFESGMVCISKNQQYSP
jgi:hypothetical protein